MMLFCPTCANICQTCPYQFPITKQHTSRTLLNSKKVDDMRDVSSELSSGAKTAYECAKCGHGFSYFSQLQIRSADEPMTTCEYLLCMCILWECSSRRLTGKFELLRHENYPTNW
ncbi:hypothetical protein EV421DRAFT_1817928 [Armillaria borealis]|uniref:TFIIS-type domain-containing protein n=1 Tax=Armillaria borealis TaxID=47425 RepID=A0AA39MNG1_9AGAR|nr:hypothetical protein EV421DRAFT_1817928 [Armillaria borealis]